MDDWSLIFSALVVPAGLALLGLPAYFVVKRLRTAYSQQGRRISRCRLTGREAAGRLLEHVSLRADCVEDGAKLDHYDHLRKRVKLRTESAVSSSVAALAIAAHEVGHAEQFAKGYWAARATRWLLVGMAFLAGMLFLFPFASTIDGYGDVNLAALLAVGIIAAALRLPIALALEADATRRAKRLLAETGLAHESEHEGIANLLRAAFHTHVAFGVGLVVMMAAGVGLMWVVEQGLETSAITSVAVAAPSELAPGAPLMRVETIDLGDVYGTPLVAIVMSVATVWWAFSGRSRKAPARTAADANNEGMAKFQAGDAAEALSLIEEALTRSPGLAAGHYNRAVVLTTLGRRAAALEAIDAMFACDAAEVGPIVEASDPWHLRGTLRLDQADWLGALEDLTRALELEPADTAALFRDRGLALIKLGRLEEALADTNAALDAAPEDAVAFNNRGVIFREQGKLVEAEVDLRRSIAIDPALPNPREHLAKLIEARRSEMAV